MIEDKTRDQILTDAGYRVIRIPYFVQMTEPVIGVFIQSQIVNRDQFKDFPHGFISDTVVFPADFCELGVVQFVEDLERFAAIRADILGSLARAAAVRGDWRLVYPLSARKLLAPASEVPVNGPNPKKQRAGWATLDKLFAEAANVWVIHYSCESFYDRPNGQSPRITSIAVRKLNSAQTRSFSIHQVAERRKVPSDEIEHITTL